MACCLCKKAVSAGQEKKKRKLYGDTCIPARRVLQEEMGSTLDQFRDTQGADTHLCSECYGLLIRIHEFKSELEKRKR